MIEVTPWQLGVASSVVRALASGDEAAIARWVRRPWLGLFGGGARIRDKLSDARCHRALAPWREGRGGSFTMRTRGATTLVGVPVADEIVALVLVKGLAGVKLTDVRVISATEFDDFGTIV